MRCGSAWCGRQSLRLPVKSREVAVFDEMVLREPNVIKPVAFAPRDLIENLAIKAIRCLPPLSDFGSHTKDRNVFCDRPYSCLQLLTTFLRTPDVTLSEALV